MSFRRFVIAVPLVVAFLAAFSLRAQPEFVPASRSVAIGATIKGTVTSASNGAVVVGATVEILSEGVFVVATRTTDALGRYTATVPNGVYDVRARAGGQGFLTQVAADVNVAPPGPPMTLAVRNFALVKYQDSFVANGFTVAEMTDSDGDMIFDPDEDRLGSNPFDDDTNNDGVADGIAELSGASATTGIVASSDSPDLVRTTPSSTLPLSPSTGNAPIGVRFKRVRSATGYTLTLTPSGGGAAAFTHDYAFESDELLIAADALCQFNPPAGMAAGNYDLAIRGFYGNPSNPVGVISHATLSFVMQAVPASLNIVANVSMSGLYFASDITVAPNVTVAVPAGQTLTLVSCGPYGIKVQSGAQIVAAAGSPGGSIELVAANDILVRGMVKAGDGASADDVHVVGSDPAVVTSASGTEGAAGGAVSVLSNTTTIVTATGRLATGLGGAGAMAIADGSPSTTPQVSGGFEEASGGRGGAGGSLVVSSPIFAVAARGGRLVSNNGGEGGSAYSFGGAGGQFALGGGGWAVSGSGGRSGECWIRDFDFTRDGYCSIGASDWQLEGGEGGLTGECVCDVGMDSSEVAADCGCSSHQDGVSKDKSKPNKADGGWFKASDGEGVELIGGPGIGCGNGGDATCVGGDGGDIFQIGLSYKGWGFGIHIHVARLVGGTGGTASATGGEGGNEGEGRGGQGKATGGKGGDGIDAVIGVPSGGGAGGLATAIGGDGHKGKDCCSPPAPGIAGGGGGSATARGGNGGDANHSGGNGGAATADAKNGQNGGNGCGPGGPGTHGYASAVGGDPGSAIWSGDIGQHTDNDATLHDGMLGVNCCNSGGQ